jgi:glycosyltransferase involved in cell wall biosynthesis
MTIRIEAARPSPFVSLVIPCLDEAKSIAECVQRARAALQRMGIAGEVVVADIGSIDGAPEIAAAAGARIVHCSRRGYGQAICAGVRAARGDWLIVGDADGSYDFDQIDRFTPVLAGGADLVMGKSWSSTTARPTPRTSKCARLKAVCPCARSNDRTGAIGWCA